MDVTQTELLLHGIRIKGKLRNLFEAGKAIRLVELKPVTDKKTFNNINSRLSMFMKPATLQEKEDLHLGLSSPRLSSDNEVSDPSEFMNDFKFANSGLSLSSFIDDVGSHESSSEQVFDSSESGCRPSEPTSRGFCSKRYKRSGLCIVPQVHPPVKAGSSSMD